MTPVRLEPAALRSRVKHSTTEPLRSLYPDWCKTEQDKIKFKQDYFETEGIRLENVEKNKGMRAIAKIMLNNLWGKLA